MKTPKDITATTTIMGLVSRTSEKWLDVLSEYRGERTPAAVGDVVHKCLQIADKVNHTNGERLFFWCNWSTVGAYLLQLGQDDLDERRRRRPQNWPFLFATQTPQKPTKPNKEYKQ